jgi:hypothetical protein
MQIKGSTYAILDTHQHSPLEGEWTHLDGEGTQA